MPAKTAAFVVPVESRRARLDHFLAIQLPEHSRARLQQLIREGRVAVDGRAGRRPGLRLRGGERITVEIVERLPLDAVPEEIPLRVLYEDDDLAVIDKPAGLVVHAGAGRVRGTLVNALLHRFRALSSAGGPLRPGIVHRLDKDTSGVLVVAKNDAAHRALAEQFQRRQVEKRYLALVHGRLPRAQDTIRLPVARDRIRRTRMTTRRPEGRAAETSYRVLATRHACTLVELALRTGRTHQIRVHLAALGHPVVGDALYGAPRRLRWDNRTLPAPNRNFLHACRLRFLHPSTGRAVDVSSPLPPELEELLHALGFAPPAN
jgi:23S rRNA pseudouridine1911/1915/1917 synthase